MTEAPRGEPGPPVGRSDALAALGLALLAALVFFPTLRGEIPLLRDFPGFTVPSRELWQDAWSHGRVPEWNRFVGLGLPILAAPVHGAFYPGHLPLLLGSVAVVLPVLFAVHAVVAGLGAYFLARLLGCGAVAAFVGAAPWVAGGYAVSMWQNGEKVLSGAWIPWAIACLVRAVSRNAPLAWCAAAASAFALVALAGDPFLWADTLALALPLALCAAREHGAWPAAIRLTTGRVALTLGLGLLLASPALVPAWVLRGDTERAVTLTRSVAETWSLHPVRWLELLAPGALGDSLDLEHYPGGRFADDPTVQALPWAVSLYTGAAAVLLPWLAGRSRTTFALVGAAVVGWLAALGKHTAVYSVLRAVIFPLGWTRYPEKHVLVTLAALTLLSALGVDRALRGVARLPVALAAFVALALLALALGPADLAATVRSGLLQSAIAAVLLVAALSLGARHPKLAPLVGAVAAVDLGASALPLLDWTDASHLASPPPLARALVALRSPEPPRLHRPRADHLALDTLPENAPSLFGIGTYPGHDPAKSARLHTLEHGLGTRDPRLGQLLRLDVALVPDGSDPPVWTPLSLTRGPRAWLVGRVSVGDDTAALARFETTELDPEREAVVAPGPGARALSTSPAGACNVVRHEAERLSLHCTTDSDALVVVSESWADGWTARLDDRDVTIVRADVALRGVYVGRGAHDLHFAYRTPGLALGLALGDGGLLGALALLVTTRRASRRSRAAATDDPTPS